jgi:hypothetical protein
MIILASARVLQMKNAVRSSQIEAAIYTSKEMMFNDEIVI